MDAVVYYRHGWILQTSTLDTNFPFFPKTCFILPRRVSNATVSVANVEDAHSSTRLLAQTTLRNILGTKDLYEILSNRESISGSMQANKQIFFVKIFCNIFNCLF